MDKDTRTQCALIRDALLKGRILTPLDALREFGCFRLGARIWDLRHRFGLAIRTEYQKTAGGKRIAAYSIRKEGE